MTAALETPILPPMLAAQHGRAAILSSDGSLDLMAAPDALRLMGQQPVGLAHTAFTLRWLGAGEGMRLPAPYDVLELFMFVRPACNTLPHARGLAHTLDLDRPQSLEDEAIALREAALKLLAEISRWEKNDKRRIRTIVSAMQSGGWPWAGLVLQALGAPHPNERPGRFPDFGAVPDWEDEALPDPPGSNAVEPEYVRNRLTAVLGQQAKARPAQISYAELIAEAFQPREDASGPIAVLAEAGTGTGKTAGYLSAALSWVERNGSGLWLSTYTKALQTQLAKTLEQIYPDPDVKDSMVTIRKGRENYLCMLNFEDAIGRRRLGGGPDAIALGLVARWMEATADGDIMSGDFPSWAWPAPGFPAQLTLRAGECIYSACPHYRKCFVEKSIRKARASPIVIANHALVMAEAQRGQRGPGTPVRYVFDEGHHLFDAADGAFAIHVTGREGSELRRWIRGPEGRSSGRGRGLRERVGELLLHEAEAPQWIDNADGFARDLPGDGWHQRIKQGGPRGAWEQFLSAAISQVLARSQDAQSPYGAECDVRPLTPALTDAAMRLHDVLGKLQEPLSALAKALRQALEDKAEAWDRSDRMRAEALARGLERRATMLLPAWRNALASMHQDTPEAFADWLAIERSEGRDVDAGLFRHWIDPTVPLAHEVFTPVQGVVVTSATLNDRPDHAVGNAQPDVWAYARGRTGAHHLKGPVHEGAFASPFDYAKQTRVIVVNDVTLGDSGQLAGATRALFEAAGGGALGLFTSIKALKAVHSRIAGPLAEAGLTLYAQHTDGLDPGTLVSLFRAEDDACLLGTDALRDGVDVPGRSLRLVVFDRVPWPRPDILHKARRARFGRGYDDALVRGRIAQAFGRLIRRESDHGVFVILDARTPSRLLTGLPSQTPVHRTGLQDAIGIVRQFLKPAALALAPPQQ